MPSGVAESASLNVRKRRKSYPEQPLPPVLLPEEEQPLPRNWRLSPVEMVDVYHPLNGSAFLQDPSAASRNKSMEKGKIRVPPDLQVEEETDVLGPIDSTFDPAMIAIEPLEDDEAETRRVEENLRRWEREERQQRKVARTSASIPPSSSPTTQTPSLVSYLWPPRFSVQQHTALGSQESMDVPLTELGVPSPRTASPIDDDSRSPTPTQDHLDPFTNPNSPAHASLPPPPGRRRGSSTDGVTPISPFDDAHQVRGQSSPTTTMERSRAQMSSYSQSLRPPAPPPPPAPPAPPRPLGLPPPRTPPPVFVTSPTAATTLEDMNDDVRPTLWWHEWLCGCGEGPDRGGDFQAGRTNPFE